ncbi:MAG: hypothetical protein K5821_07810 [Nitrobacter sp.]|nr:hypothetical protein [Nitrobacter sp.]MCV0386326.1 hypothetical protein [Nitrobacter sp.]
MLVFRYFVVMGCCLVGLLFAADLLWSGDHMAGDHRATARAAMTVAGATSAEPRSASRASGEQAVLSSIENWRRSEQRFERAKQHLRPVVYPNVVTLAPTPDRLQWERQLRYLPADHVYEARAEMPKEPIAERPKVAAKTTTRKHVAHARSARMASEIERSRYARNAAWDPFGLFD